MIFSNSYKIEQKRGGERRMTEKRFTKCDTKIRDYGEEMSQAEVRDMLNALHEENQEMQKKMNRLYNYFEDFFSDVMSNEDFGEQWEIVADDEKWD